GCCMFPAGWFLELMPCVMKGFQIQELQRQLAGLERQAAIDFVVAATNPDPRVRLRGVVQMLADQDLADRLRAKVDGENEINEARAESLRLVGRLQCHSMNSDETKKAREQQRQEMEKQLAKMNPRFVHNYRWQAEHALTGPVHDSPQPFFASAAMIALFFWPSIWVIWAFFWRGGLSYRIVQIALVRSNGRPAGRFQCAWRALLVWAPLTA